MNYAHMNAFLDGAIVMAALAIAVFFARFGKRTGDRLFTCFAIAFGLMAVEHIGVEFVTLEERNYIYLIRLAAFLIILFAIWNKNWKEKKP